MCVVHSVRACVCVCVCVRAAPSEEGRRARPRKSNASPPHMCGDLARQPRPRLASTAGRGRGRWDSAVLSVTSDAPRAPAMEGDPPPGTGSPSHPVVHPRNDRGHVAIWGFGFSKVRHVVFPFFSLRRGCVRQNAEAPTCARPPPVNPVPLWPSTPCCAPAKGSARLGLSYYAAVPVLEPRLGQATRLLIFLRSLPPQGGARAAPPLPGSCPQGHA